MQKNVHEYIEFRRIYSCAIKYKNTNVIKTDCASILDEDNPNIEQNKFYFTDITSGFSEYDLKVLIVKLSERAKTL